MKTPRFLAVLIAGFMLALVLAAPARSSPVFDHSDSVSASSSIISQAESPAVIAASRDVISADVQLVPATEAAVVSLRTNIQAPENAVTMKKPKANRAIQFTSHAASAYKTSRTPARLWRESYRS